MSELHYTPTHIWLRAVGEVAITGLSNYGAHLLKKANKIELPEKGTFVTAGKRAGTVYAGHRAISFFFPVSGIIVEINKPIVQNPDMLTDLSESQRWFFKIRMTQVKELASLLSKKQYIAFLHMEKNAKKSKHTAA